MPLEAGLALRLGVLELRLGLLEALLGMLEARGIELLRDGAEEVVRGIAGLEERCGMLADRGGALDRGIAPELRGGALDVREGIDELRGTLTDLGWVALVGASTGRETDRVRESTLPGGGLEDGRAEGSSRTGRRRSGDVVLVGGR